MGELHQKLVKMVDRVPAFPKSVHRVLQLTSDLNYSHKELIRTINHDPVMTLKILKLVNSAYFGFSGQVASINQAVVSLGMNTVKNLAISVATRGMLPQLGHGGLHTSQYLLHSVGVGTVAKLLAQKLGEPNQEWTDYFVAGLLHDFGKVLFSQFMPGEFQEALETAKLQRVPLHQAEKKVIGADHTEIGSLLGEKWQLPPRLVAAVRCHHDSHATAPDSRMLHCVQAANYIVRLRRLGDAGDPCLEPVSPSVVQRFGMEMDALAQSLSTLEAEMEKAQVFIRL
ncbi:MAG: HDOD domain-containing protein [Magnetococcales bacterium]|nr:HDOD domain-containing protein [Magnetococcales bacterium]MBF0321689.1 HDOD domain-containing protein [Magnetococcales bacterium]